jgi:hypothetical protein
VSAQSRPESGAGSRAQEFESHGAGIDKLSARFVATVVEAGRYSDGGNLYLSVSRNGGRRWVLLFRWEGKPRQMGLGSAREITLARARERAAEARLMLAEGQNPMASRAQQRAIPTFGKAADAYVEAMEPGWKNLSMLRSGA